MFVFLFCLFTILISLYKIQYTRQDAPSVLHFTLTRVQCSAPFAVL